ncbi:MAG: YceI family protein [Desulfobacterales bacterium]|jgi:polyisoprenoid-binding protein YceI|nr:YceI family protein [Desulfobacterales bacterium]
MKQAVSILVMVLCALLITNTAVAEAEKWEIDKAHTNIYFDVRHTYATVRGQFDDFSGTLQFDPDNMALSSVKFEVKTTSINTGIPNRDNHLRSEEFFAVNQYPFMTFQSTGVKRKEGNQYTLVGNLTIKGKTNEVAVLFTYFGTRENPLKKGKMVAGFETRFSIDRLEYQVGPGKYFEMGVIGRNVDILITLEVLK